MFYIVEFTDEKACEIVPESWIVDEKCAWPNTNDPSKIRNFVSKSKQPKKSWKFHNYRVLFRHETYELALANLNDAMKDSDLSDFETAKKKIKLTAVHENEVPLDLEDSGMILPPERLDNDVPQDLGQRDTADPVQLISMDPAPVLTSLNEIKFSLQQVLDILLNLSQRIEKLENLNPPSDENLTETGIDQRRFRFPLVTHEQLIELNEELGSNQEYKKHLIKYLFYKGGSTAIEAVKLMIKALMDDELSCQYSLVGARGKQNFEKYSNIYNTLQESLIMNPLTKGSGTEVNLRTALQNTFKLVADHVNARLRKLQDIMPPPPPFPAQ